MRKIKKAIIAILVSPVILASCSQNNEELSEKAQMIKSQEKAIVSFCNDLTAFENSLRPIISENITRSSTDSETPSSKYNLTKEEQDRLLNTVETMDNSSREMLLKLGVPEEDLKADDIISVPFATTVSALVVLSSLDQENLIDIQNATFIDQHGRLITWNEYKGYAFDCMLVAVGIDGAAVYGALIRNAKTSAALTTAIKEIMSDVAKKMGRNIAKGSVGALAFIFEWELCMKNKLDD